VPVRRSPFFNVTWSANRADDNPRNDIRVNTTNLRNTTYLQLAEFLKMKTLWKPEIMIGQN